MIRSQQYRIIAVAVVLVWAAAPSQAGSASAAAPPPRTPPFIQTRLSLDLALDYDRPAVDGTAAIALQNRGDRVEHGVPLLLNRLMSVRSVTDEAGRRLPCDSTIVVFEDNALRQVVAARVALGRGLPPGGRITLRVEYGGPLVGYAETGSLYIKDHIDPAFTILRADALAFPVVGVPSDRANRAMRPDVFDFDARITVPESQVVATGGTLSERRVSGGRATYHFAGEGVPFVNIAIAPYRVAEAGGIRAYVLPDDEARAGMVLDAGRQALARLESWYGPLPAPPRVSVIEIPEGFGSQASLTAGIILDAAAFRDKASLPQFYHELSHFWNPTDLDVPSPRWNEGLATFLQYRLAREIDGFTGTAAAVERARTRVCAPAARADLDRVPFEQFGAKGMTDYSYRVGFLFFTALEELLGAGALDGAVRDYVQTHLARGGTTAGLLAAIARRSPAWKPDRFFKDWMEPIDVSGYRGSTLATIPQETRLASPGSRNARE